MKFTFIEQHRPMWPVEALCRILGVSRSGYAAWRRRKHCRKHCRKHSPSVGQQAKQHAEARLRVQIHAVYRCGRGYYGSPRVHHELRAQGKRVSRKRVSRKRVARKRVARKRVARLMKQEGLVGRSRARRRVSTTNSRHGWSMAPNHLQRCFAPAEVARPNRFWCGDITYLPTREGWLYLATVKDLFSRRILGWAVADTLEATLVTTAWRRALFTRGFSSRQGPELYHSDRGSQYAGTCFQAHAFRRCWRKVAPRPA